MTDRMFRKIKMLSKRFVFIFADITFESVYSFSDTVSSFSNIQWRDGVRTIAEGMG